MRVFVVGTGRCGTTTWAKACSHLTNYTSAHESKSGEVIDRLVYPDNHIEIDNRLSWFLGSLQVEYGRDPLYIHLTRDPEETALSFAARYTGPVSLTRAFGQGIIQQYKPDWDDYEHRLEVSRLAVKTINDNISDFLSDKPTSLTADVSNFHPGFSRMCERIGAIGDIVAAHKELDIRYNKRPSRKRRRSNA